MKFISDLRVSWKQATCKIEAQINWNASLELGTAEFELYWNGTTGVGMVDFCHTSFCVPWCRTSLISERPFIVNISSGFFVYSLLALHMYVFSVTISHIVVLFFLSYCTSYSFFISFLFQSFFRYVFISFFRNFNVPLTCRWKFVWKACSVHCPSIILTDASRL